MKIKPQGLYSVKETAVYLNVTERYLQQKAKREGIKKIDNRYLFSGHYIIEMLTKRNEKQTNKAPNKDVRLPSSVIKELQKEIESLKAENKELKNNLKKHPNLTHREQLEKAIELITIEAVKKGLNHRVFTDSEYDEMVGTLAQVDNQEEQINYLRKRVEKQDEVLNKLANTVAEQLAEKRERNFIEAKEKGLDN